MSYEDIKKHISHKIRTVNVNNPKANWGARVLNELDFDLDLIDDTLYWAVNVMQTQFRTKQVIKEPGRAGLTMVSMAIGEYILEELNYNKTGKLKAIDQIRVGDLILEGFVKYGYITLERPVTSDMMYMIEVTDRWATIGDEIPINDSFFKFITFEPVTDGCRIKGEHLKRDQDTVWCRAAKKAMAVPKKINRPVYEALRANKYRFVSEVEEEDPLRNLQRISRLRDMNKVLEKAKAIGTRVFYEDAEVDYRGRLYCGDPVFNFQSVDWARGIIQFADGKKMTPDGEYWLAVHTAASFNQSYDIDEIPEWCEADYRSYLEGQGLDSISVDKFTLNDRVRWTNANMEEIIHAGQERLFADGAEKDVAFLACCVEWYEIDVAREEGRDHISYLPVAVDGSNNGWQHLGAMSKDTRTGELVGLVAQEIQQDFYVQTAKQLLEIDDPKLNAMPMKMVRKYIAKRGSMTRAYSAGATKIAENMWIDVRSGQSTEEEKKRHGVTPLDLVEEDDCKGWAKSLIKAINEVCPGPLSTMKYMQQLAAYNIGTYKKFRNGKLAQDEYDELRQEANQLFEENTDDRDDDRLEIIFDEMKKFYSVLVEGNGNKRMKWITPSQFPVTYECYQYDDLKCRGTINGKQIKHVIRVKTDRPDVRGYMSGIAPNYVHSMDASHLSMIVDRWDGTLSAVHDSFSTHACDVDNLLILIKDTFIEMYDVDNFLDKISKDLAGKDNNIQQPTLGSLEIQEVYDSDYFFA